MNRRAQGRDTEPRFQDGRISLSYDHYREWGKDGVCLGGLPQIRKGRAKGSGGETPLQKVGSCLTAPKASDLLDPSVPV